MSSVRVQHDVYAQVLVNHVYDVEVLPRIKANTGSFELKFSFLLFKFDLIYSDEYGTYIRLIDEILEQRYTYVIQSRRTIETFPVKSIVYRKKIQILNLINFSMLLQNILYSKFELILNDNYIVK